MEQTGIKKEKIVKLETMIDHLTGEEIGLALDNLNDMMEILDAVWLSAIGKKNRPCGVLQVLCFPEDEDLAVKAIFRHTHSLGVRRQNLERYVLPRETGSVNLNGKDIKAKFYKLEGDIYIRPESDFIKEEAEKLSVGTPALRIMKKGKD